MVGVLDPRNRGRRELVLTSGSSDVSTTGFSEWDWAGSRLVHRGYFVLRDGGLQQDMADRMPLGSAVGAFDFSDMAGKTALLAGIVQNLYVWQSELFTFIGDSLSQHRVLWSDSDHDFWSPSHGIFIDLDGKGLGILRFLWPHVGGPRFEFYRL